MNIENEISKLKATQNVHQGMIEIMTSYIDKKLGHDDFFEFLKTVAESKEYSKNAILVAERMAGLESSFGQDVFHKNISVQ